MSVLEYWWNNGNSAFTLLGSVVLDIVFIGMLLTCWLFRNEEVDDGEFDDTDEY